MAALPARRFAVGCVRVALLPPLPDAHSKRSQFAILASGAAVLAARALRAAPNCGEPVDRRPRRRLHELRDRVRHHAFRGVRADRPATRPDFRATRVASRRYGIAGGLLVGVIVLVASTPLATTAFGTRQAAVATAVSGFSIAVSLDGCRIPGRSPRPRRSCRARRRTLDRDHRGVRPDRRTPDRHARGHDLGHTRPRRHQRLPRHAEPRPLRELPHPLRHDYRVRD